MALLPKDKKSQQLLLLGMVPLLLAFIYYQFVYSGTKTRIEEMDQQVANLKTKNDAMAAVIAQYGTELPQQLAVYEEHMRRLEQLIPRREDVPMLISNITERAHSLGVELAGLNPAGEEAGEHYSRQSYELQVLGDYHRLADYITAIGSLPRIIRPARLNLNVEGSQESAKAPTRMLRARFRIETYISPDSTPAPVIAPEAKKNAN
jgi:type IV pilus assembly protein PilO